MIILQEHFQFRVFFEKLTCYNLNKSAFCHKEGDKQWQKDEKTQKAEY